MPRTRMLRLAILSLGLSLAACAGTPPQRSTAETVETVEIDERYLRHGAWLLAGPVAACDLCEGDGCAPP